MNLIDHSKERLITLVLLTAISINSIAVPIIGDFSKGGGAVKKNEAEHPHVDSPNALDDIISESRSSVSKSSGFFLFSHDMRNDLVGSGGFARLSQYNLTAMEQRQKAGPDSSADTTIQSNQHSATSSHFQEDSTSKLKNDMANFGTSSNFNNYRQSMVVFEDFSPGKLSTEAPVRHLSYSNKSKSSSFANRRPRPVSNSPQTVAKHPNYTELDRDPVSKDLYVYSSNSNTPKYLKKVDSNLGSGHPNQEKQPFNKLPASVVFKNLFFSLFNPILLSLFVLSTVLVLLCRGKWV